MNKDYPNIILVIMDCARPDHMSCYGYERHTTPNIDRIAQDASVFTNAISPAIWTLPSIASIFTGTFVSKHGTYRGNPMLCVPNKTIAEFLTELGYYCIGISNIHWISRNLRFDRGFSTFIHNWQIFQEDFDLIYDKEFHGARMSKLAGALSKTNIQKQLLSLINGFYLKFIHRHYDYGARKLTNRIRVVLPELKKAGRPFFLFLHYFELHGKYDPPRPFRDIYLNNVSYKEAMRINQNDLDWLSGKVDVSDRDIEILRALYDSEMAYMDFKIGQFYGFLKDLGLLDNTILILTADHGENLGEHGMIGHRFSLYDTLIRVPLIIRYPSIFPKGCAVDSLVQTVDIYPTLVSILSGYEDKQLFAQFQGQILPPVSNDSERKYAISEYLSGPLVFNQIRAKYGESIGPFARGVKEEKILRAIRTKKFKFIRVEEGEDELYDLESDSAETRNLIRKRPQIAKEMHQMLETWLASFEGIRLTKAPQTDVIGSLKRRLQDLGYL